MLHSHACFGFISFSIGNHQGFRCAATILRLPKPAPPLSSILYNQINHREWKNCPVFFSFWNRWSCQAHRTPHCIIQQAWLVLNFPGLFILFKCAVKFQWLWIVQNRNAGLCSFDCVNSEQCRAALWMTAFSFNLFEQYKWFWLSSFPLPVAANVLIHLKIA